MIEHEYMNNSMCRMNAIEQKRRAVREKGGVGATEVEMKEFLVYKEGIIICHFSIVSSVVGHHLFNSAPPLHDYSH